MVDQDKTIVNKNIQKANDNHNCAIQKAQNLDLRKTCIFGIKPPSKNMDNNVPGPSLNRPNINQSQSFNNFQRNEQNIHQVSNNNIRIKNMNMNMPRPNLNHPNINQSQSFNHLQRNEQNIHQVSNNNIRLANKAMNIRQNYVCNTNTINKPEDTNNNYTKSIRPNLQKGMNFDNQNHVNISNVNNSNYNNKIRAKLNCLQNNKNIGNNEEINTKLNPKFDQRFKIHRKFDVVIEKFFDKNDFSEIFECDSVEPIFLLDSNLILDNSNYYITIAENEDKNALYFQIFYIFLLTKNLQKNLFIDVSYPSSTYIEKIHSCIQQLKRNISNIDNIVKVLEKINEIKKTPPQEVFSLSRLICVFFRIAIIKHLKDKSELEIIKEYDVHKIDKFIEYMCNLSKDFPNDEKILKTICEIYNLGDLSDMLITDPGVKILQNNFDNRIKILKFNEIDDKRCYYALFPKNQFDQKIVQKMENDLIEYKKEELKQRFCRKKS